LANCPTRDRLHFRNVDIRDKVGIARGTYVLKCESRKDCCGLKCPYSLIL